MTMRSTDGESGIGAVEVRINMLASQSKSIRVSATALSALYHSLTQLGHSSICVYAFVCVYVWGVYVCVLGNTLPIVSTQQLPKPNLSTIYKKTQCQ